MHAVQPANKLWWTQCNEELFALISSLWHLFLAFCFFLLVLPFDFVYWFCLLVFLWVLPLGFAFWFCLLVLPLPQSAFSYRSKSWAEFCMSSLWALNILWDKDMFRCFSCKFSKIFTQLHWKPVMGQDLKLEKSSPHWRSQTWYLPIKLSGLNITVSHQLCRGRVTLINWLESQVTGALFWISIQSLITLVTYLAGHHKHFFFQPPSPSTGGKPHILRAPATDDLADAKQEIRSWW